MATVQRNTPRAAPSTPSEEMVRTALQEHEITDSTGRRISLRKPGPLAQYRLVEAAGASSGNATYMAMSLPLIYVSAINGDPVPPIQTKAQLEARIQHLDDHGIEAVMEAVSEHYGAQDPEADKDTLKNS